MRNERRNEFVSYIQTDGGLSLDSANGPIYHIPEFLSREESAVVHEGEEVEVVLPFFKDKRRASELRNFSLVSQEAFHPYNDFAIPSDLGYLEFGYFLLSNYELEKEEFGGRSLEYYPDLILEDENSRLLELFECESESGVEVLNFIRRMQPRCRIGVKSLEFIVEDAAMMVFGLSGDDFQGTSRPLAHSFQEGSVKYGSRRVVSSEGDPSLIFHYRMTHPISKDLHRTFLEEGFGRLGTELVLEGEIEVDIGKLEEVSESFYDILDTSTAIFDEFEGVVGGEMRFCFS